jgi:tetratricopeptide (TPR) repeat protein
MLQVAKPFVATTLGTCRIADPILTATRKRPIKRANQEVYGFAHTAREVLQQVDCLVGARTLPEELDPYLSDRVGDKKGDIDSPADFFMVEISTTKEFRFRDWVLQVNYVERAFRDLSPLLGIFKTRMAAGDREERRKLLEAHPLFAKADALQQAVLLETYVHNTTKQELAEALVAIRARLPAPSLFLCHIDLDDLSGRPLAARRQLCGWMRELCGTLGIPLLDPTPHVIEFGRARALEEDGRDLNHYSNEFKFHYGCLIYDRYCVPAGATPHAEAEAEAAPAKARPAGGKSRRAVPKLEPVSADDIAALLGRARQVILAGELDAAEAMLSGPAATTADGLTLLAMIAGRRGDQPAAEAHLRGALAASPAAIEAKTALVKLLTTAGRLEDLPALTDQLLLEAPEDPRALGAVSRALSKLGRFPQAAAVNLRIAELAPREAGGLVDAARMFAKAKDWEQALTSADAALARVPSNATALAVKAKALAKLRRLPELAVVLLQFAPVNAEAAIRGVALLVGAGMAPEAAAVVAAARRTGYEGAADPALQNTLVRQLAEQGQNAASREDAAAAVAAWKALQLIDPHSRKAASGLRDLVAPYVAEARRLAAEGDLAGSEKAYRQALALDPDAIRAQRELGSVLERASDWLGAVQVWRVVASVSEAESEALIRAARCARRAELYTEALGFYRRLEEADRAEQAEAIASIMDRVAKAMSADYKAGAFEATIEKAKALLAFDSAEPRAEKLLPRAIHGLVRMMRDAKGDDAAQRALVAKILAAEPKHPEAIRTLDELEPELKRERKRGLKLLAAA